jgi:hypothetical protein
MKKLYAMALLAFSLSLPGCASVTEWLFGGLVDATGPSDPSQNRHGGDADYRPSP